MYRYIPYRIMIKSGLKVWKVLLLCSTFIFFRHVFARCWDLQSTVRVYAPWRELLVPFKIINQQDVQLQHCHYFRTVNNQIKVRTLIQRPVYKLSIPQVLIDYFFPQEPFPLVRLLTVHVDVDPGHVGLVWDAASHLFCHLLLKRPPLIAHRGGHRTVQLPVQVQNGRKSERKLVWSEMHRFLQFALKVWMGLKPTSASGGDPPLARSLPI